MPGFAKTNPLRLTPRVWLNFINRFAPPKTPAALESLVLGTQTVPLLVVRNPRARRYLLRLRPDGTARVTIPRGGSQAEARAFVERNRGWLEKQVQLHQARPRHATTWPVGSEIWFRGERVKIESIAPGKISFGTEVLSVNSEVAPAQPAGSTGNLPVPRGDPPHGTGRRLRNNSCVHGQGDVPALPSGQWPDGTGGSPVPPASNFDLRPAIEKHLRQLAAQELPPRVRVFAAQHQIAVTRITVRNQKSRWGSCSRRGTISLNWRLIQTPDFVRDYILLHELAHRRHMNHSARFWSEVERLCPDFRTAERWLKTHRDFLR